MTNATTSPHLLLHRAIREGNKVAVVALLDAGVSVHTPGSMLGNSPLHSAVLNNQMEIADLLLQRGADIHQVNNYDHDALYSAIRAGRTEQADYLLAHGADIHKVDEHRNNYLHLMVIAHKVYNPVNARENAAAADLVRGIEWLLAHDVDARVKNDEGHDAEALAAESPDLLNKIRVLKARMAIDATLHRHKNRPA